MNVLFDLDGTLFDTYPSITKGIQEAAGTRLDETKLLSLLKESSIVAFEYFDLDDDVRVRFKELERNIHPSTKTPFPFIEEVLKENDVNVIVTHKDRESVQKLLAYWKLGHYFDEVLCLEDDVFPRKPEIDSYLYLHNKYQINLVVGDRTLDFIPAEKLGIPTCSFQNNEIKADYHINSYKEFEKIKHFIMEKRKQ